MSGGVKGAARWLAPTSSSAAAEALASMEPELRVRIVGHTQEAMEGVVTLACAELRGYEHSPADQTLVAATGERLGEIEAMLAEHGQRISVFPLTERQKGMTLGALLGGGKDVASVQRYGRLRESLIGAEFVLPDGTRAHSGGRVIKNVAGYDLAKIMVGSLGALAFVTAASLRLYPLPRRSVRVRAAADLGAAVALVDAANRSGVELATCEWGGGEIEFGIEGPSAAVEAAVTRLAGLLGKEVAKLEVDEGDSGAPSLALRLAEERESFDGILVKLGTRLSRASALQAEINAEGLADEGVWMHSHLGTGIHYLGVPGPGGALGRLDLLLQRAGIGGQLITDPGPGRGSVFVGRRPGGLTTMRRLLDGFDPLGRLVSPMRTSIMEETGSAV